MHTNIRGITYWNNNAFFLFSAYGGTKAGKIFNFAFQFCVWYCVISFSLKLKMFLGHFFANYIWDCLEECHLVSIIKSNMCHVTGYKNLVPFSQPVGNEGNIKHLTLNVRTMVLQRFSSVTSICFPSWLVYWIIFVCCDWLAKVTLLLTLNQVTIG